MITLRDIIENKVFFIAEIGKNFIVSEEEESVDKYIRTAKGLIDAAISAGAHAVKFQTHEIEDEQYNTHITSPHFPLQDRYTWVKRNNEATPNLFWENIFNYGREKGIYLFSTPMSRKAAIKLSKFEPPFWKVGSGDVLDFVLLDYLVSTKKPIIISTGMVSFNELDKVVSYITGKNVELAILYCVSHYPADPETFNLSTIEHMRDRYPNCIIGFSDHSVGDHSIPNAAVCRGAKIIEKHFSFDRSLWGSDHKVSLTPREFKDMVNLINSVDKEKNDLEDAYYGVKDKELDGAKNHFRSYFQKALVAGKELYEGKQIEMADLFAMRPYSVLNGIPSHEAHSVVGKRVKRKLKKYDILQMSDLY